MENPYSPPTTFILPIEATENRLTYVWIWLHVAFLGALVTTPADMFSMVQAMAFALPCYLVGVIWGSPATQVQRTLVTCICTVAAGYLFSSIWVPLDSVAHIPAVIFAATNVYLGFRSGKIIQHHHKRLFVTIAAAYLVGLPLGPAGVLLLTIPTTLVAGRKLRSTVA